jgi:serine/threonine protein kinase
MVFESLISLQNELGRGGFGVVSRGILKDGSQVAIKITTDENNEEMTYLKLLMEKNVLNIIHYLGCWREEGKLGIILEFIPQSIDLFEYITRKKKLEEDESRFILGKLIKVILKLKELDICHGDIKDENILIYNLTNDFNESKIKLIDFGSAFPFSSPKEYSGTKVYAPPEICLHKTYTSQGLSVWSLGILLYNMLFGDVPFQTVDQILNNRPHYFHPLSWLALDLIESCLTVLPENRLSLEEFEKHPWF